MKKLILICSMTILFQGCLNMVGHYKEIKGEEGIESVYEATRSVWNDAICVWWLDKSNFQSQQIIDAYTKLTYPFWVIDLPFEAVFDTITFPYDLYKTLNKKEDEKITPQEEKVEPIE